MNTEKNENNQPSNFEKLHKVFANVNDWLKFAETKNGTLIAFNTASIFGVLKFIDPQNCVKLNCITIYLFVVLFLLILSTVVALVSFVPKLKIIKTGLFSSGNTSNVLFYEYMKNQSDENAFVEITGDSYDNGSKIEKDLANQIVQNSIIASRKYSHFTIAIWITVIAYVNFIAVVFWLIDLE